MTTYSIGLFVRVAAAVSVFASFALDAVAVAGLPRTTTTAQARTWIGVMETSSTFGPWARITVLLAGLYLAWQGGRGRAGSSWASSPS
jgi:hypothetical protein